MQLPVAIGSLFVVCVFSPPVLGDEAAYSPDGGLSPESDAATADAGWDAENADGYNAETRELDHAVTLPQAPVAQGLQTPEPEKAKPQAPRQIDGTADGAPEAQPHRLEGVVQARYVYQNASGGTWQGSFEPPFARVGLVGRVGRLTGYQVSAAVNHGSPELFTAFAEIAPFRFLSLRAGQMRVPFSRASMTAEEFLTFPERPLATRELAYLRDIGVSARAHGLQDRLELVIGAYNGNGPNRGNDNLDPMLLARVAGVPLGQPWQPAEGDPGKTRVLSLAIGGTATVDYVPAPTAYGYLSGRAVPARPITDRDSNRDGQVDDVRVVQFAADVALRFRGLAFEGELYQRRENWKTLHPQPGADALQAQTQFRAWFAQLSYFVLAHRLQIATRASVARISPLTVGGRIRPEATCTFPDASKAPCPLPYADVRSELAALVALHLSGLRISASFARYRWSSDGTTQPPPAIENQITILTQWIL